MNKTLLMCVLFACLAFSAVADEWNRREPHYLGLNTELDMVFDSDKPVREFISLKSLSVGVSYGYKALPLVPRARLNLGWYFGSGFYPSIGLEFPVLEKLSDLKTKQFGLYFNLDAGWAFGSLNEPVISYTLYGRIPLGLFEGIGIGASYTAQNGYVFFVSRCIGAYPISKKRS